MRSDRMFGWSYPAGCSGPPDEGDEDKFRASGNARQRRKALRAHVGRCDEHGMHRDRHGECHECQREEYLFEAGDGDPSLSEDMFVW